MNHTNFKQIINIFILCFWRVITLFRVWKKKKKRAFAANTFSARLRWFKAKAVAQLWIYSHIFRARAWAELHVKASLDTRLSSGFRTTPSVSLKTGRRPAKGGQHVYTRQKSAKHKSVRRCSTLFWVESWMWRGGKKPLVSDLVRLSKYSNTNLISHSSMEKSKNKYATINVL